MGARRKPNISRFFPSPAANFVLSSLSKDRPKIGPNRIGPNWIVYTGTPHTSFFSCTVRMRDDVYHTTWLKNVFVRIRPYSCSPMISGWLIVLISLFLALFLSVCPLFHPALLLPLPPVLCPEPLLPCGQRQGKDYLRLRQSRSLALWQNSLLPQVVSPSSLTTSATRRLPKTSSRRNSATKTRCPRTQRV